MFRTTILLAMTAAIGLAALLLPTTPTYAASATGTATVKILKAVTVTKSADLNFGRVAAGTKAATVKVAEDGTRTCGAGLTCLGSTTAGAFDISGTPSESVSVAIDHPDITLSSAASDTLAASISTTTQSLVLDNGKGSFRVAGLLKIAANQPSGTYTGQFEVSVNYQ